MRKLLKSVRSGDILLVGEAGRFSRIVKGALQRKYKQRLRSLLFQCSTFFWLLGVDNDLMYEKHD
jgi:hypothetical protein